MKKLKLLGAMTALAAMLAAAVWLGSPYEPVVGPVAEIETVWAIEDARQESETPLVKGLRNHGVPLGYDAESSTFYCTLGLEQGDAWPELHLTASCGRDVRLLFVDDYSYDWCKDAVAEGYPYQALAYTDDAFWYFNIVFTGLPIVSLYCEEDIGVEDTPAAMSLSVFGEKPVSSAVYTHLRGGGTRFTDKKNLRVNFIRNESGRKNMIDLPGFGLRENVNLNPMVFDETMLRERISWRLYGDLLGAGYDGAFGARKTAYAEVFLNDAYQGVYLMMEPMEAEEELSKAGSMNLLTDGVYRSIVIYNVGERPVTDNPLNDASRYELRYEPTTDRPFALLEAYLKLLPEYDAGAFREKAVCMDQESVVRYALLRQVAGLADNVNNNMYLWARRTPEGIRYTLAPWDMDYSWGRKPEEVGEDGQNWLTFSLVDRMLLYNPQGFRELMLKRWDEWRQNVFTQEHITGLLEQYASELTDSGALMRNADRWDQPANVGVEDLTNFAANRLEALDAAMDMLRETEHPHFLPAPGSGKRDLPIL